MQCRTKFYYATLLSFLIAAVFVLGGCTNPEKAKAEHLSKGEAYLKDSKFQEASIEFRNAVQIDDKLAAAHWGLARAYEGLGRFQETFEELRKTTSLDANNLDSRVKLGNYYMAGSKGKPELIAEAGRLANEILEKDQNHIEGHILKGSVLFAEAKPDEAFAELNRAIEIDPKRAESYLSLARFHLVNKDPVKAEQTFQRAISVNNNSALAHTEYGKFLAQLNRLPEAEAELKKAVEVDPADRNPRFFLASYYLVTKQLDRAEESYRALGDLDKDKPEGQAILADFYSAINRLDDAAKIYQDILTKSPDYAQGRYRLAEINLARGDKAGANTQIDEALKKDQHDRQALLLRARVRASSGEAAGLKDAIEDLKEVLKQEPNSKAGLYFMSQANLNLGLIDQARAFAADLERNYPDYLPGKLTQIQISLVANPPDLKGASRLSTELIERLKRTGPDRENSPQLLNELHSKALIARGSVAAQSGNIAAARQDFMEASAVAPRNTDIYTNLASLSMLENKPDDAAGFYEKALANDATNFNALSGLLGLHTRRNELDKAHGRIDQVLSSYPNNASLHFLKAQIYGVERNPQGAETELRKTLELDPNYIAAYSALGALFINTKQEDRAIGEYTKILERRPDNASAYTMIGMLYDSLKKQDEASENYRKALEKDQNAVIAANNLAWLIAVEKKGNLDEAVRLAQGVVQKNPNVAGFVDTLGWVYYQKGLYAAAAEQLQKAVSLDEAAAKKANAPPSATYHYHLGMALNARGDKAGARRELGAALQLADKNPFPYADDARKALATL